MSESLEEESLVDQLNYLADILPMDTDDFVDSNDNTGNTIETKIKNNKNENNINKNADTNVSNGNLVRKISKNNEQKKKKKRTPAYSGPNWMEAYAKEQQKTTLKLFGTIYKELVPKSKKITQKLNDAYTLKHELTAELKKQGINCTENVNQPKIIEINDMISRVNKMITTLDTEHKLAIQKEREEAKQMDSLNKVRNNKASKTDNELQRYLNDLKQSVIVETENKIRHELMNRHDQFGYISRKNINFACYNGNKKKLKGILKRKKLKHNKNHIIQQKLKHANDNDIIPGFNYTKRELISMYMRYEWRGNVHPELEKIGEREKEKWRRKRELRDINRRRQQMMLQFQRHRFMVRNNCKKRC